MKTERDFLLHSIFNANQTHGCTRFFLIFKNCLSLSMKHFLLFYSLLLLPFILFAQQNKIDSLVQLLNKDKNDTNKVIHLYKLCRLYKNETRYDSALCFGNSALQLAKELTYQKGIASSYNNLGVIYDDQGNYARALENYFNALKTFEIAGDKYGMATTYNNIGIINYEQAQQPFNDSLATRKNYQSALHYYSLSLNIRETLGDKHGIADCYTNIGVIHDELGNLAEALVNYFKSLKIRQELNDKLGMESCFTNIGIVYDEKAATLHNKDSVGICYASALDYYSKSLAIAQETGDKKGIIASLNNIGIVYKKSDQLQRALDYFNKALLSAKETNSKTAIKEVYKNLSDLFTEMGDYKNAYNYFTLYSQTKDSLFNSASNKQIAEMQAKYATEKKEREIQSQALVLSEQKQQLNNNKFLIAVLLGGAVLLLFISWILITKNKIRQKEIIKTELLRQQELRTRAIIETQENERKRIAQDLHDGIGQTLAAIKMNLSSKSKKLSKENQDLADQTILSIDNAYSEVRTLSHSMMPRSLKESGLAEAIEDLLAKTFSNSNIKYTFEKDNSFPLNEQISIGLYRVLQELLNNIIKHAHATELSVHLHKTKENIILMAEDNGIGIRTGQNTERTGIGMANIEARVQAMNGNFSITKNGPKGTVAVIRIPIIQKDNSITLKDQ